MATNLFTKTRSSTPNFYVFDAFPASAKRFVEANPQAKHATSLSQMAAETDVIVTMLPGPAQVKEVYLGKGGLLEGAKKGQLFVDSSTIDAGTVIDVSKVFSEKTGAYVIDAPVSGGVFFVFAIYREFLFLKTRVSHLLRFAQSKEPAARPRVPSPSWSAPTTPTFSNKQTSFCNSWAARSGTAGPSAPAR